MEKELWMKQPWDTDLSYRVFVFWLEMDKPRDLDAAWRAHLGSTARATDRAPEYIRRHYRGSTQDQQAGVYPSIGWEERARGYDIAEQRRQMVLWEERRNILRRKEWDAAEKLLSRAMEMLEWPIHEETYVEHEEVDEDGSVITIFQTVKKPVRWAIRDIQAMVKVASEVARLSAEMSQGKFQFELSVTLSSEALAAIDLLEKQGIQYPTVVKEFESILIDAARKYSGDADV